jgi:GNAT superfamily N-acetyltransferase
MEIRILKESELDDLLNLYSHVHAADDPLPDRSVVEAVWKDIQDSPKFQYFGAFVGGRLVSSCTISIMPNFTRGCRSYGLIENVVTHTDYRRKGYGTAVLQHALEYAWGKNCYKVMLLTSRKDEAIHRFYESAGFDGRAKQAFIARQG